MYNVSDKYKSAVKSAHRKSKITGTLTTKAGVKYELNDTTFIKDSFFVTNQCVNGSALNVGTVYAGEIGFIINSQIDRYSLFGACIKCDFTLIYDDGTNETIPLGVYYVDTAERTGNRIKITAVDNMSKFDESIPDDTNGTWYELLSYACVKCGVSLAQTQAELEALHSNTTYQTYTSKADKIDTYRDLISYLCSIICAFATIDNTGKLKVMQYGLSAVDSNDRQTRLNNCNFSDYSTRYNSVTARFFKEENYYPYLAKDSNIKDALLLDMGDIPIVGGTPTTKQKVLDNVLNTLKQIVYVPSTLYIASNPAYELGDMIQCDNVNNTSDSVNTYVMAYKYEYRKKETVKCYGENPLLQSVKDKTNKQISSIENSINDKDVVSVTYNNAKSYEIMQAAIEIVRLSYSISYACKPIILASIPFTLDCDGIVEFKMYNGQSPLDNATFKEYYEAGEHFATLFYLDNCEASDRRSIRVYAKCYADTTSSKRTQDAEIITLNNALTAIKQVTSIEDINALAYSESKVDATEPTMTVNTFDIRAVAFAQGISGAAEWDGVLEVVDNFFKGVTIPESEISVDTYNASVSTSMLIPDKNIFSEAMHSFMLDDDICIIGINDKAKEWSLYVDDIWNTLNATTWQEVRGE